LPGEKNGGAAGTRLNIAANVVSAMADQQFPKTSAQLRLWKMSFDLAAVVINLKPQLLNSQAQS